MFASGVSGRRVDSELCVSGKLAQASHFPSLRYVVLTGREALVEFTYGVILFLTGRHIDVEHCDIIQEIRGRQN